jgi:hypothetical protein
MILTRIIQSAESNQEIYIIILMAIICYFKEWLLELESVMYLIKVLKYHKDLGYVMTIKIVTHDQKR